MRSRAEKIFLIFFYPAVVGFYLIYKYPLWFVQESEVANTFYWFGKSTGFWYNTAYTAIVCGIAAKVLLKGVAPYGNGTKPISGYQKKKFTSIFLSQLVLFYLVP